jgi:signal transduction protein with GAF and PtsI domain
MGRRSARGSSLLLQRLQLSCIPLPRRASPSPSLGWQPLSFLLVHPALLRLVIMNLLHAACALIL